MKTNLYRLLISVFSVSLYSGCARSNSSPGAKQDSGDTLNVMDTNYQKVGFDTTILLVEKKAINYVSWNELFGIKEFVSLCEPNPHCGKAAFKC